NKIRISGFANEAEDCEAQIPRAREASKIRDILDNTAQNTKHGKVVLRECLVVWDIHSRDIDPVRLTP
ncbi:hypothetical protein Tco_0220002, partial [Tanacetum coccineum]